MRCIETVFPSIGPNEAADVLEAIRNQQSKAPVDVLRPKVDKFGTVHRSAKWILEKGYESALKRLGKDRDYTLIMETEMGSYGVGIELLNEYNSKVVSATLIDENGKQIETCKKA